MSPRRLKKGSVKRLVEKRVAKAIEEYEKIRADSNNTRGSGSANTRRTIAPDEDHQRRTNNNNPNKKNHHQQQNRRQETAKAYAAALTEGKVYAENLPKCNRCNLHHHGPYPPKFQRCQRMDHMEKDCRARLQGAGDEFW
ncbi:hypothetical protein Tco_1473685 [Tanacetum coccineum]